MWLNQQETANLLSIPQLEEDGYHVTYDTLKEWILITPQGKIIVFKRDTGICNRMPYIDMREHKKVCALVQTVCKNLEGYTFSLNQRICCLLPVGWWIYYLGGKYCARQCNLVPQ